MTPRWTRLANRFVTIDWERCGVLDGVAATGAFLKLAGDHLRRHGATLAHVWVQENGHRLGCHVHILMHVPAHLARGLSHKQRGWLKPCGATFRKGLVKTGAIGRGYRAAFLRGQGRAVYLQNLADLFDYLPKDAGRSARQVWQIKARGNHGLVTGKRCGTSQNVGRAARSGSGVDEPSGGVVRAIISALPDAIR